MQAYVYTYLHIYMHKCALEYRFLCAFKDVNIYIICVRVYVCMQAHSYTYSGVCERGEVPSLCVLCVGKFTNGFKFKTAKTEARSQANKQQKHTKRLYFSCGCCCRHRCVLIAIAAVLIVVGR